MSYKNYLSQHLIDILDTQYETVQTIEELQLDGGDYAIYYPWAKTLDFKVSIKNIVEDTLYLEKTERNPYRRTYIKHINVDFPTVIVFKKVETNPNIQRYDKSRFIEYFTKCAYGKKKA